MNGYFIAFFCFLLMQRTSELRLAKKNADWIKQRGGYEVGATHYKYIVAIHAGFFLTLASEVLVLGTVAPSWWLLPLILFFLAQLLRYWCIQSLGPYWNTRIYILPEARLIKKGPYRWVKHPNYWIVITEIALVPLIFGAYYTAIIWSFINFCFLKAVRIPTEEKALLLLKREG